MSLYGALFAGVAGLTSQARKLGVISDNVSNVNTVGYKGGNALFQTLVTSSSSTAAYSPGGVIGGSRQLVSKQGLLQATDSSTDIAISGGGFFVVNQNSGGDGSTFYTRSGSFRADSLGNYRNASGFYLQAWPLDREGRLPGAAGNTTHTQSSSNLGSLEVVNVGNLGGSASATTSVSIGANLNAAQTVFPGISGTITMDSLSANNGTIAAKDIIVPGGLNGVSTGDKLSITTGSGLSFVYRYGGFTNGRSVTDASGAGSGLSLLAGTTPLGANPFAFTAGSNVVTVTQAAHGLVDGAVVTLSGNTLAIAGIPSSEFNSSFVVDVTGTNTYTFTTSTSARAATDVTDNTVATTLGANSTVTLDVGTSGLFFVGQDITVAGASTVNGVTINGTHTITAVSGTTVSWATTTTTAVTALGNQAFTTSDTGANPTFTVDTTGSGNTYIAGQTITIAGSGEMNGVDLNGTWTVTSVSGANVTFDATGETAAAVTLGTSPFTFPASTLNPTVVMDVGTGNGVNYQVGDSITIVSPNDPVNGLTLAGTYTVTVVSGDNVSFVASGTNTTSGAFGGVGATVYQNDGGGASVTEFKATGGGTAATAVIAAGGGATSTINSITRPFSGNILDATNAETRFLGITGTTGFTTDGLTFKITTAAVGTVTFSYTSASPDVRQKQFNNLSNLAAAVNEVSGLSARVVSGKLYVGATDATAAVTFENGSTIGTTGPVRAGIDWVRELGLENITANEKRFSSLQGLYNLATTDAGISASLANPLGDTSLSVNVDNPLDTIRFSDSAARAPLTAFTSTSPITTSATAIGADRIVTVTHPAAHGFSTGDFVDLDTSAWAATTNGYNGLDESELDGRFEITVASATSYTINLGPGAVTLTAGATGDDNLIVTPHNNQGSLVAELGLVTSLNGTAYGTAGPQATTDLGPSYSPTDTNLNMASGSVVAQFSRPIRIYDAQGGGHDLNMAFLKTSPNTWAVEVYSVPADAVSSPLPDGLVAYGNVAFNGDGTLSNVDTTLTDAVDIAWTNASSPSAVTFDWGTAGQAFGTVGATTFGEANGLSQFSAAYKVSFANQNGAPVGELTSVSISELGVIVASYSNGQTQDLYKIPIAAFANPDQLTSNSGNVFGQSADSGEFNLQQAGTSGVGKIASSSLEASNVELSQELTDMIVAQRSYQANAKVISTSDSMLNVLNDIIR